MNSKAKILLAHLAPKTVTNDPKAAHIPRISEAPVSVLTPVLRRFLRHISWLLSWLGRIPLPATFSHRDPISSYA